MSIRFRLSTIMTLLFICVFSYVVYETWNMELQARLFPWAIGIIALLLLVWQFFAEILVPKKADDNQTGMDIDFTEEEGTRAGIWRAVELFGWIYGFAALLWLIGFYVAIPATVFLYMVRQREDFWLTLILPTCAGLAVWGLFDNLIHVPFPPGALYQWLGWVN